MQVTKDQIMATLPTLEQGELLAIKTLAGALLQQVATPQPQGQQNAQGWLFTAMQGVLGIDASYMPDKAVKSFNRHAPQFLEFVQMYFQHRMHKKVDAVYMMTRLVELIETDLQEKKIPVTMYTMTTNLSRIREVFEQAFPGYISSNLTQMIKF